MKRYRIAILMHERDSARVSPRYVITKMAEDWREDGHETIFLFGPSRFVPADIIIVHVDLSVVPDSYLEFAQRYPVAVNGRVRDIRKTTFSRDLLLARGDSWEGRVIVKSELNYGGLPERRRVDDPDDGVLMRAARPVLAHWGITIPSRKHAGPEAYRVFETLSAVPDEVFGQRGLVVQKFLPEREGDEYFVRNYSFLGDRESFVRLRSKEQIVNGTNSSGPVEEVESTPELGEFRRNLGMDYGKIDYALVDGRPIIFDVNKTIGRATNIASDPVLGRLRRHRSSGLYSFLNGVRS